MTPSFGRQDPLNLWPGFATDPLYIPTELDRLQALPPFTREISDFAYEFVSLSEFNPLNNDMWGQSKSLTCGSED